MAARASLDSWLVEPGRSSALSSVDPESTPEAPGGKNETGRAAEVLNAELASLQERLWADARRSMLVVLQAMDAGGKDGTIKKVFTGVNPQGVEVTSFKVPSDEERAHDFLWRVHKRTPALGRIGIFNRSHYEDVLVVRVHGKVSKQECRKRYAMINDFERMLVDNGTTIVKLMLHISFDEQGERMRRRLEQPNKRWKFRKGDLEERARWADYQRAYEDAIKATSTAEAPWYVVPANHKWYRDWAVLQILAETLRTLDPQFPEPIEDLAGLVVQ